MTVDLLEMRKVLEIKTEVIDAQGDLKGKKLLLQEIDVDPLSNKLRHADFIFVDERHEIEHEVPLRMIGESAAAKSKVGVVDFACRELTIKALPQNLPAHIDVDVSALEEIGSHVLVKDILCPKNVEILNSPDDVIVSIVSQVEETEGEVGEIDFDAIQVKDKGKKQKEEEEG